MTHETFGALIWDSIDATSGLWVAYDEATAAPVPGTVPVRVTLQGAESSMRTLLQSSPFIRWIGRFTFVSDRPADAPMLAAEWPEGALIRVPAVNAETFLDQWTADGVLDVAGAGAEIARRLLAHHETFQQWIAYRTLRSVGHAKIDAQHRHVLPDDVATYLPHMVPAKSIHQSWQNLYPNPPPDMPSYIVPFGPEHTVAVLMCCVLDAVATYKPTLIPGYKAPRYPDLGDPIASPTVASARLLTPLDHLLRPVASVFALPRDMSAAYMMHHLRSPQSKTHVQWSHMISTVQALTLDASDASDPVDWAFMFRAHINTSDLHAYVHADDHRTLTASEMVVLRKPIRVHSVGQFFAIVKHLAPKRKHVPWFSVRGSAKRSIGVHSIARQALDWIGSMPQHVFTLWSALCTCWPDTLPWKISRRETQAGRFGYEAAAASCMRAGTIVVVPWCFMSDSVLISQIKSHAHVAEVIAVQSLAKTLRRSEDVHQSVVWMWADWTTPMEWFYMTLALCELTRPDVDALRDVARNVQHRVVLHLSTTPPVFVDVPQQAYLLHRLAAVPVERLVRVPAGPTTLADRLLLSASVAESDGASPPPVETLSVDYWSLTRMHAAWTSDIHAQTLQKQLDQARLYTAGIGEHFQWQRLKVRLTAEVRPGDCVRMDWHRGGRCGLEPGSVPFDPVTASKLNMQHILTAHPVNACSVHTDRV